MEQIKDEEMMHFPPRGGGETSTQEPAPKAVNVKNAQFQPIESSAPTSPKERKIGMLLDLTLPVSIELGRTNLLVKEILDLQRGSIIEFDKLASEPVDVLINGKKMAEGEVVVIEKHFGIRVTNLVDPTERLKNMNR